MKKKPVYFKNEESETAILLLHAYTGSPNDVISLGRRIEKAGYSVYIPLLSGHGTESIENVLNYTVENWRSDAVEAYDFLLQEKYSNIMVFGLSLGGLLAVDLIESHPQVIAGGVFCSPLVPMSLTNVETHFLKQLSLVYKKQYQDNQMYQTQIDQSKKRLKNQIFEIECLIDKVYHSLSRISCPVMLVQSGKDELIDAKSIYQASTQLKESLNRTYWYPNSNHVITVSKDKRLFERDVLQFIHNILE